MDMNVNTKIPNNNKKLRRYKTVDDLPLTTIHHHQLNASMLSSSDISISKNINEAKVIKLKRLSSNGDAAFMHTSTPKSALQLQQQTNDSSFTSVSTLDDNNNHQNNKHHNSSISLPKLYIVRDFNGSLIYGDLSVKQGEFVYLVCKSDSYYFVENQKGKYGFIPGEICVDLSEITINAHYQRCHSKVTSF